MYCISFISHLCTRVIVKTFITRHTTRKLIKIKITIKHQTLLNISNTKTNKFCVIFYFNKSKLNTHFTY